MDEWDQWNQWDADSRPVGQMRQIALEAEALGDDGDAFERYAASHQLRPNEVVYYLNAYEYGGDAGLQAIHAPDIIPPAMAQEAIKTIAKMLDQQFAGRLPYRLTDEGTAIGLYEIQQRRHTGDKYLFPICQFRVTLEPRQWHLYWRRQFEAWWPYASPERGRKDTLQARVRQVIEDEWGCFWG
jgi:hypothetical protein